MLYKFCSSSEDEVISPWIERLLTEAALFDLVHPVRFRSALVFGGDERNSPTNDAQKAYLPSGYNKSLPPAIIFLCQQYVPNYLISKHKRLLQPASVDLNDLIVLANSNIKFCQNKQRMKFSTPMSFCWLKENSLFEFDKRLL